MKLSNSSKGKFIALLIISSLTVSACSNSIFDKRIEETEEKNKIVEKEKEPVVEDLPPAEVEISEEQKEALEKAEIKNSAEEAVENSTLSEREEVEIVNIPDKAEYTDVEEFSQFVNALFYQFHTQKIDAKTFFQKLSPHFSENFKSLLPKGEKEQLETFEVLQKAFNTQIKSEIKEYQITNVEIQPRVEEASVYRKYTQSNGGSIYYESIFVKENNRWLLFDDSPSPPYVTAEEIDKKLKKNKGE